MITPGGRRCAVITGGGRGIGRAVAVGLAGEGFDLVVGWHSNGEAARATAASAEALGATVTLVQGDVSEAAAAQVLARGGVRRWGLDAWVNNAGISVLAPLLETSGEEARRRGESTTSGPSTGCSSRRAVRWHRAVVAAGS